MNSWHSSAPIIMPVARIRRYNSIMRRALALAMLALVVHLTALTGLSRCAPAGASAASSMDMAGMMHGGHGSSNPEKSSQTDRCPTIAACALAMAPITDDKATELAATPAAAPIAHAVVIASWIAAPETPPPRV
jgi:hypothetical protein